MVLVDSSVWIRHFRQADRTLLNLIRLDRAVACTVVLGELLLGSGLSPRDATDLAALPQLPVPPAPTVLEFLKRHASIRALGIGWADLELLATCARSGALLYTADVALRVAAARGGIRLA
jgi:predicted nucleic acid-binding protein